MLAGGPKIQTHHQDQGTAAAVLAAPSHPTTSVAEALAAF
jgi:hypothetical protein